MVWYGVVCLCVLYRVIDSVGGFWKKVNDVITRINFLEFLSTKHDYSGALRES